MELYIELSMARKSEKDKCSVFLYVIGQKGWDVYNTMNLDDTQHDKINILFTKFEEYCKTKQNMTVERHQFNTRVQDKVEQIDRYVTDLWLSAKNCSFRNLDNELIRDRIVCGVNLDDVKQQLLRVQDLGLDKALTICREYEQSKKHIQYLSEEIDIEHVHSVNKHKKNAWPDTKNLPASNNHNEGQKLNPICGNNAPPTANSVENVAKSTTFRNGAEARRKWN